MSLTNEQWGYVAAVASMFAFGSFNIPLKLRSTQRANPDPMVFQIYINIAVFLSSWIVLSYTPPFLTQLTYWGIVSGTLWVFSSILSVFAVTYSGLAVSQGIWAGCTIIVSFFWGSVIFQQELESLGLSLFGLLMLMIGIIGMSVAGSDLLVDKSSLEMASNLTESVISGYDLQVQTGYNTIGETTSNSKKKLIGYACAATLALTNGSMLAPIHYAPDESQGVNFLVSFGIGVISVTPIFSVIYYIIFPFRTPPQFKPKELLLPGLLAGLGWNIGNWASIYATQYLGYTVGFPLSQCALLISGFWGIALFKEITGWKRILLFIVSSLILVGGAIVLSLFGRKS